MATHRKPPAVTAPAELHEFDPAEWMTPMSPVGGPVISAGGAPAEHGRLNLRTEPSGTWSLSCASSTEAGATSSSRGRYRVRYTPHAADLATCGFASRTPRGRVSSMHGRYVRRLLSGSAGGLAMTIFGRKISRRRPLPFRPLPSPAAASVSRSDLGAGGAGNLGFASNGRRPKRELTNDQAQR